MQANDAAAKLDRCLDRFLDGGEWRELLAPDDPPEVRELMEVAELVFATARKTPQIETHTRRRLWTRLFARFAEARLWQALRPRQLSERAACR